MTIAQNLRGWYWNGEWARMPTATDFPVLRSSTVPSFLRRMGGGEGLLEVALIFFGSGILGVLRENGRCMGSKSASANGRTRYKLPGSWRLKRSVRCRHCQ